jgi:cation:H+ antiporter
MTWVFFGLSSFVIVLAAMRLAEYGDAISLRTKVGGMFVGTLLIAGATSLPELLTTINSLKQGAPDLAAGNLFGSNMFNMVLLAVLDMAHRRERILRKAALKHALTGSLATFLIGLVVFFVMANIDIKIGWVGVDSVIIVLGYLIAVRLLQTSNTVSSSVTQVRAVPKGTPGLAASIFGFLVATGALIYVTPILVRSSLEIAEISGLGATFIGTTLVALVTSLPELVTTLTAAKMGADDMAIGNLFGSNLFNIFAIGLTDFFYTPGRFLGVIDPAFLLVGMLGLIMTGLGLIGNLAKLERRLFLVETDALLLFIIYFGGMWLLYSRGISP